MSSRNLLHTSNTGTIGAPEGCRWQDAFFSLGHGRTFCWKGNGSDGKSGIGLLTFLNTACQPFKGNWGLYNTHMQVFYSWTCFSLYFSILVGNHLILLRASNLELWSFHSAKRLKRLPASWFHGHFPIHGMNSISCLHGLINGWFLW